MEIDAEEPQNVLPFQLQFDKPITFQIKIAEWNPEKDLLAMVIEDSKILLHRFNWQRLWTISPGKCVMSLCWRPDGKAIAVGLEDGSISLHDVENGKLLKSVKSHTVAVVCLNWVEDGQFKRGNNQIGFQDRNNYSTYEDRTHRFFPPAPRAPRASGVVSGDAGFVDDSEETNGELSSSSCQRFNILCSGDKDGNICFSIFGIFLIGKVNVHKFSISLPPEEQQATVKLLNASICKIALSKDLCRLIVMCSGELTANMVASVDSPNVMFQMHGLHGLVLDTSIFWKRKNELHQLAQQASNIEDLTDVIRSSLSVMSKQWSDAMRTFRDKFNSLSSLIADYALDSTPQEEFLSLLGGAQISPAVHQFLVNTLGEVGVKRVAKVISSAGKELQRIILEHLQPAAEIIGFRIGELCGLSRWRSRFQGIGLDELLMDNATEKSGMMLVQVERIMEIVSSVEQQFSNFFNWLLKCIKLLMQQPIDQLPPYNSELIVVFLKFLYDQDPIRQMLEQSDAGHEIAVDFETMQRVKELVQFGGFSDCDYLRRSLAREFQQLEFSFKEAFLMPFSTISRKIVCVDLLPLFPLPSSPSSTMIPMSMANYEDSSEAVTSDHTHQCGFVDYICFQVPTEPFPETSNIVCVMRGVTHKKSSSPKGHNSLEAVLLAIPAGYDCVDLSLYKDMQVVLLLNGTNGSLEGDACIMIVQSSELPFVDISRCEDQNLWKLNQLKDSIVQVETDDVKVRQIPHSVIAPLVISASRGLACVFATRKRALVYILEEDEEEIPDIE